MELYRPVHHNYLLSVGRNNSASIEIIPLKRSNIPLSKPTVRSVPCLSLSGTWRHHEEGGHADNECNDSFNQEQVSPS